MIDYEFDRVIFDPDFVIQARSYLATRGYTDDQVLAVSAHLRRFGTAECCPAIRDDADRSMLESFVPRAPEIEWHAHESFVWALGPETNPSAGMAH